jgi:hypothetical protein
MLATVAAAEDGRAVSGFDRLVVVTPSPSMEDERRARALTPAGAHLYMSSGTWFEFGVLQAGTFLLLRAPEGPGPHPGQDGRAPWGGPGQVLGSVVPSGLGELRSLLAGWRLRAAGSGP